MGSDAAEAKEPLSVSSADDIRWDEETDVLIVGYGGAGVCAAIEAREQGAEVLAVDRFEGGGATAFSGGIIYAGGTRFQAEAGVSDDAEEMFKYLSLEAGDVVRPETLKRYCDESGELIEWLVRHGVPYSAALFEEKTLYPPDGKFLYYAGNEKVPEFAVVAKPAPRGHRPVGASMTGHVYFAALARAASGMGVKLRAHEKVGRLITDATGRVIGVETRRLDERQWSTHKSLYDKVVPMVPFKARVTEGARKRAEQMEEANSGTRRIRARRAVVIASGGFALNLPMIGKHIPLLADSAKIVMRLGSLGCDGSGIELAHAAGGAVVRMDSMFLARNIAPPNALLQGVLVNADGRRFINEESYSGYLGLAILRQRNADAWLILSGSSFRLAIRQAVGSGLFFFKYYGLPTLLNFIFGGTRRAKTLEKLAKKCGIDPVGLHKTVQLYNDEIKSSYPDNFGKSNSARMPIADRKYYAVNMAIANRFSFTYMFTLGGLKVDEADGAVLRDDNVRIPGLYAAGRAAVGLCSNGYISGLSIGDGAFSGRRAGSAAAAYRG